MNDGAQNHKKVIPIVKAEALIPPGIYCYEDIAPSEEDATRFKVINPCPFHRISPEHVDPATGSTQGAGFCGYLNKGDWMEDGTSFLWDRLKECGVKDDEDL